MAEARFDVVYAGGGYGALMSAPYFAMNGMSVGVFEHAHELGGGAASEPRPLPGFVGNPHFHVIISHLAPQVQDFKLWEKGLKSVFPERDLEMVFPDGSALSIFRCANWDMETGQYTFNHELLEKNAKVLERLSPKDADRLVKFYEKIEKSWLLAWFRYFYNPPTPWGVKDAMEELMDNPEETGLDPRWQYMPYIEVLRDMFESKKFQMMIFRMSMSNGMYPQDVQHVSCVMAYMLMCFGVVGVPHIVGGSHQMAHALQRRLIDLGGKTFTGCEVDKILVENGRAKGIKLSDGTEIEAKKLVVANINPHQVIFRMLRDFPISDEIKRKVNNIIADRSNIFWGNICYHERPKWIGEAGDDPGFGQATYTCAGDDDMEYIAKEYQYRCQHIRPGNWPPKLYMYLSSPTVFGIEPTVAPPGKQITLLEEYGPPASGLSEREWIQVRREFPIRALEEWAKYAPNMVPDSDNIIGWEIDTPWDCLKRHQSYHEGSWIMGVGQQAHQWGRFRPIPELSQYQVPGIENLFLTGNAYHSGIGSQASYAYCLYKKVAEKYGLRKFWEEAGRPY